MIPAGASLSIMMNPFLFPHRDHWFSRREAWRDQDRKDEVELLADVLRSEPDADKAGGDAPEQGPLRQPPDEPGR